jgi:phospholipid/cholesterol/gamma-HCH transport system permease protein
MITALGTFVIGIFSYAVSIIKLFFETLYWMCIGPFKGKAAKRQSIFEQMVFVGILSLPIVFFVDIFTGIVLAMQTSYQLQKMGAVVYVASLVAISLCRELGPVLTALVVAGRVGSAITAEISSMKVTEQIEALDTMAINPIRFLAVPRVLALFFMLPALTIVGNISGIIGGFIVGVFSLRINPYLYIFNTFNYLTLKDIYTGLSKAFVFGIIIALVGCHEGLSTSGGAEGVGRSTTRSVVISFILIILADCVLTSIYYLSKV